MRYPLVQGQGNFGSIDGDPPAASRYTEAKLAKVGAEMLVDLEKETVDFVPNYDESLKEPSVLPSALPNLLINGSSGIAVGMATNMAPHNLTEIGSAIAAFIDNPEITVDELMKHVSGPDFPTGGIIFGRRGIREAYVTGRGKMIVRGKFIIETMKAGREQIVFTEIPYAVNKTTLITRIADLVRDKVLDGVSDLRDESDREGMRIVLELKKGAIPKLVLNRLFAHTPLQTTFGVINMVIDDGRPKCMGLRDLIGCFVAHRVEVVSRRSRYELRKAEEKAHILRGLVIALQNIDEVVQIIKTSKDTDTAKQRLETRFGLDIIQSQAILDMRSRAAHQPRDDQAPGRACRNRGANSLPQGTPRERAAYPRPRKSRNPRDRREIWRQAPDGDRGRRGRTDQYRGSDQARRDGHPHLQ